MTLSEKLIQLQEIADAPSRAAFADIVGVNTVTLNRMAASGDATDRILARLAGVFDGLSPDMLRDDNLPLPEGVRLSGPASRAIASGEVAHEGVQFKAYMERHDIRQAELAEQLGVSRVTVHAYTKTERFRAPIRASIAKALNQPEEVIFGSRTLTRTHDAPNVTFLCLPIVRATDRHTTPDDLATYQREFNPATQPDRAFHVSPTVLRETPEVLADAIAIEITERDNMAPALRQGAIVMAVRVEPSHWDRITEGNVVLLVDNQLRIRRVYRNNLRTENVLEVGASDPTRGGSATLRREDVQALFQITYILISPA